MKNKKGFTLVEMLAVVALIALFALIIIPSINSVIKKNREKVYKIQLDNIIKAAKNWGSENYVNLPAVNQTSNIVTLNELKKSGLIDEDIRDARTKKCINNNTFILINKLNKRIEYKLQDEILTNDKKICGIDNYDDKNFLLNSITSTKDLMTVQSGSMLQYFYFTQHKKDFFEIYDSSYYETKNYFIPFFTRLNYIRIKDHLFSMLYYDDKAIYALYQGECSGNSCTLNNNLNNKNYYGFGTSSINPVLDWESNNNQLEKDMDAWVESLDIDEYLTEVEINTSNVLKETPLAVGEKRLVPKNTGNKDMKKYSILNEDGYAGAKQEVAFFHMDFLYLMEQSMMPKPFTYVNSTTYIDLNTDELVMEQVKHIGDLQFSKSYCSRRSCSPANVRPIVNLKLNLKYISGYGMTAEDMVTLKPYIVEL